MSTSCEVLIVGAGPTGLTAALALTLQGVRVRIIDEQPIRHATARASAIHARTMELLAPLGIADRIVAYAQPTRVARFLDASGQELLRRELEPIDSPYAPAQNLQQWQVEWMLAEQLLAHGVPVEADTRLVDLTQDQQGVEAHVISPMGTERICARFLVGADGARSRVRQAVGLHMEGKDYPERWVGGELAIDPAESFTEARIFFATGRIALAFPLDSGIMFFATLRAGEYPDFQPGSFSAHELQELFDATFGQVAELRAEVRSVPWSSGFRMHSCAVPDYRSARVFLAGDAAHLCSAAGGFGMNAGIHDAVNLAWRLTAHLRLNADDSILDGYNTDRREMFDVINAASDANHTLWTALDREDRVLGMRSLPSAAIAAAARDMGEVSFSYRNDSMWFDQAEPSAIHAGMRMPPAADMGNSDGGPRPWSSLYDGRNWTFVLAVADRTRAHAAYLRQLDMVGLAWLNARTRFVLCVGDVFAWTAPRPTLYVIRPDGYIAFRLDADPDTLPEISVLSGWLATTFGGSLVAAEAAT